MFSIALLVAVLAALNVPLLLWLCRRFGLRTFQQIFLLEWGMYACYALLIASVFILLDPDPITLDTFKAILFVAAFGMVLFAIPFALLFTFLARWVAGKLSE